MTRVLVVDDEESMRLVLRGFLEQAGFLVDEAENGKAALELIARDRYGCVITDFNMPQINGGKLAQEIKRLYPRIPVILVTGDLDQARGVPVFCMVRKPIGSYSDFVQLIRFVTGEPMS